jgi:hypothetical protein
LSIAYENININFMVIKCCKSLTRTNNHELSFKLNLLLTLIKPFFKFSKFGIHKIFKVIKFITWKLMLVSSAYILGNPSFKHSGRSSISAKNKRSRTNNRAMRNRVSYGTTVGKVSIDKTLLFPIC